MMSCSRHYKTVSPYLAKQQQWLRCHCSIKENRSKLAYFCTVRAQRTVRPLSTPIPNPTQKWLELVCKIHGSKVAQQHPVLFAQGVVCIKGQTQLTEILEFNHTLHEG